MADYTHLLFRHKSSKNQAMADYDSHAMTEAAYRRFEDLSARIGNARVAAAYKLGPIIPRGSP